MDKVWKIRAVLFTAPAIVLLTIGMACISLICSLWDRGGNTQHRLARAWSRMLLAIGALSGVTETLDAYVAAAVALARYPARYEAYRAQFTEAAWSASLGDIDGFTSRFEAALLRLAASRAIPANASLHLAG